MPKSAAERSKDYRLRHPGRANAATRDWYKRNRPQCIARQRKYQLGKYKLSEQDYDDLFAKQGGLCAICNTDNPGPKQKAFAVDHCHDTGKVRGLLCNACNRGIGLLQDSPVILQKATTYLMENL